MTQPNSQQVYENGITTFTNNSKLFFLAPFNFGCNLEGVYGTCCGHGINVALYNVMRIPQLSRLWCDLLLKINLRQTHACNYVLTPDSKKFNLNLKTTKMQEQLRNQKEFSDFCITHFASLVLQCTINLSFNPISFSPEKLQHNTHLIPFLFIDTVSQPSWSTITLRISISI